MERTPGATGDPFASFLIGQPTGGTYQSSNFNYGRTHYQAYFVEDSWQMNSRLTVNLGMRLEKPGAYFETEDRLVTFNPDVVNPLLVGRTNPETGKPYLGAVRVGGERRTTGAHAQEEPPAVCAACWRGVPPH
jgi:outer membrane receptor protein involved in Fe transport